MTPQASHSSTQANSRRAAPSRSSRLRAILLATSALASAALTTAAHAVDDGVWRENPASGDFNATGNWNGNAVPDGTATFNNSNQRAITFSQDITFGGISVTVGNYTFTNDTQTVNLDGIGLAAANGASITFTNRGDLNFLNNSSANNATIANNNFLTFQVNSTAGAATITNSGILYFEGQSTAANATIANSGNLSLFRQKHRRERDDHQLGEFVL